MNLQDFANPLVRAQLQFYPVVPDDTISELWHAEKWHKGFSLKNLTPMFVHPSSQEHFYVDELQKNLFAMIETAVILYQYMKNAVTHREYTYNSLHRTVSSYMCFYSYYNSVTHMIAPIYRGVVMCTMSGYRTGNI